ncbi:EF-hand domain-containing protein [Actinomadura sp. CNU-125]|uniref:EF-hand domain-containing protein n=1 Tax=Actinomadura sp. CNU-125 TaxID=1904961 RepID=UPI0039671431
MEFTLVLEHLGLAWTRAETQHRFEQADTNFDGFISYSELRAVLDSEGWTGGLAPAPGPDRTTTRERARRKSGGPAPLRTRGGSDRAPRSSR